LQTGGFVGIGSLGHSRRPVAMIPIFVTREVYDASFALSRFITIFADRTPDDEYVIWVDPETHRKLSCAKLDSETYSDTILRWINTGRSIGVFNFQ
jgi:hypothetical protein